MNENQHTMIVRVKSPHERTQLTWLHLTHDYRRTGASPISPELAMIDDVQEKYLRKTPWLFYKILDH